MEVFFYENKLLLESQSLSDGELAGLLNEDIYIKTLYERDAFKAISI